MPIARDNELLTNDQYIVTPGGFFFRTPVKTEMTYEAHQIQHRNRSRHAGRCHREPGAPKPANRTSDFGNQINDKWSETVLVRHKQ